MKTSPLRFGLLDVLVWEKGFLHDVTGDWPRNDRIPIYMRGYRQGVEQRKKEMEAKER